MGILKFYFSFLFICTFFLPISSQEIEWHKNYGGTNDEGPAHAVQTPDNDFIIVGGSLSNDIDVSENKGSEDLWIFKIDDQGEMIWERTYGGSQVDRAYQIIATNDGNYLIAGHTSSSNGDVSNFYGIIDFWLLKINGDGDILWERTYGGSNFDVIQSIIELENGQLLAIGSTQSTDMDLEFNNGSYDIWLIKLEENGDVIWSKNYGGSNIDRANEVFELNENSYAFIGYVLSTDGDVSLNNGKTDAWIVKLNSDGIIQAEWSVGGSQDEYIFSAIQTPDKGFLCGGRSDSSDGDVLSGNGGAWLLKLDKDFQIEWENSYGNIFIDYSGGLVSNNDNTFDISVGAHKDGSFDDYGFMKIDQVGNVISADYIGGTESDVMGDMIASSDGGRLILGHSRSDDGDVGQNYGKSDCWIIKLKGSIVNPISEEDVIDFEIYPNPSSGFFEIDLGLNENDINSVIVYDMLGKIVYKAPFSKILDLEMLGNGSYLLEFHTKDVKYSKKIQVIR